MSDRSTFLSIVSVLVAGALTSWALPAAAQSCDERVSAESTNGRATVMVNAPCRHPGEAFSVRYHVADMDRDIAIDGVLGPERIGVVPVSLFEPETEVAALFASDGKMIRTRVPFSFPAESGPSGWTKLSVVWRGDLDLDLHVVEPGETVAAGRTAADRGKGPGFIDLVSDGVGSGDHVENFIIKNDLRPRILTARLLLGDRGRGAGGCAPVTGDVRVAVISLDKGVVKVRNQVINASPAAPWACGPGAGFGDERVFKPVLELKK